MLNVIFTQTPLKYFIQSLWRDEAFSYLLAKKNIIDIITLSFKDFTPPFYYLILHFWMKIAGSSEIALRLPSLIFFWLTIYLVFLFLTNIFKFSLKKSLLYLLLLILNPVLNYYAYEARMYTMLAFLGTLSFYLFYTKKYKPYVLVSIIGLYTHYFMIFVIITQAIFAFYERKKPRIINIKLFTKSLLIIFVSFIPIIIFLVSQKQSNDPFWIIKPNMLNIFNLPFIIYTGYELDFEFYKRGLFLFSLFFLLITITELSHIFNKKDHSLFFLLWSIFPPLLIFIISFYKPIFLPRYFIFSTVGFIILLIYILEGFKIKTKTIILGILLILTLSYNFVQIKNRDKADIRKVITEIKQLAQKDDVLYVKSELDFHTSQYYFGENRVYIYGKNYDEVPNYVGKILMPKDKFTNMLPRYPKKAFILNNDLTYDIQADY